MSPKRLFCSYSDWRCLSSSLRRFCFVALISLSMLKLALTSDCLPRFCASCRRRVHSLPCWLSSRSLGSSSSLMGPGNLRRAESIARLSMTLSACFNVLYTMMPACSSSRSSGFMVSGSTSLVLRYLPSVTLSAALERVSSPDCAFSMRELVFTSRRWRFMSMSYMVPFATASLMLSKRNFISEYSLYEAWVLGISVSARRSCTSCSVDTILSLSPLKKRDSSA